MKKDSFIGQIAIALFFTGIACAGIPLTQELLTKPAATSVQPADKVPVLQSNTLKLATIAQILANVSTVVGSGAGYKAYSTAHAADGSKYLTWLRFQGYTTTTAAALDAIRSGKVDKTRFGQYTTNISAALDAIRAGSITGSVTQAQASSAIRQNASGATHKATPADTDNVSFWSSVWGSLYATWAEWKAALKSYFDTLYATTAQGTKADNAESIVAHQAYSTARNTRVNARFAKLSSARTNALSNYSSHWGKHDPTKLSIDGSIAMTGNLNMGGNNINNAGTAVLGNMSTTTPYGQRGINVSNGDVTYIGPVPAIFMHTTSVWVKYADETMKRLDGNGGGGGFVSTNTSVQQLAANVAYRNLTTASVKSFSAPAAAASIKLSLLCEYTTCRIQPYAITGVIKVVNTGLTLTAGNALRSAARGGWLDLYSYASDDTYYAIIYGTWEEVAR